ncbi:hypothetical protein K60_006160 [Mycobacterium tuberculosis variant bovis BCG str. Korea 1168P]|nr:hypothetical protein K60_006160 [Mycobacterium tuberculosis variant bovis BCG str. Korea 1168P]AHM06287.1 hypothetical protein BCGT_0366 [Mycobacterium tuberculosis variant bovis BCG str. ATCC 35743]AKO23554.1 hypothetical protein GS11_0628 [Mycobacterium tuberculosis variant bovis BCG]AKR00170.1 hypothetical protein Mb1595_p0647 [Mycobacterium tuberculosis variant bovis]AOZ41644.1 hypothetical protein BTB1458_0634 [Mycobacterium tuberculosis]EQM23393.1 hypothetical protein GuangZ0019_0644 
MRRPRRTCIGGGDTPLDAAVVAPSACQLATIDARTTVRVRSK